MITHTLAVGMLQCNCSILGCESSREALVIDPGDEVERILKVLRDDGLVVKAILHTHAHVDHLGATAPLAHATGATILLHESDLSLYNTASEQASWLGIEIPTPPPVDHFVQDGEELRWGELTAEILHTPGHSPGGICLRVPVQPASNVRSHRAECVYSGDTLFRGSIGRTDLWGGSLDQLMRSIRTRLLTLPDDTILIPGHGATTTIGEERTGNPFLVS